MSVEGCKDTYYGALSLSWYSREREKHSCTPASCHRRRMQAERSGGISPSSAEADRPKKMRASFSCKMTH